MAFLVIQPVSGAPEIEQLTILDFGTLAIVKNDRVSTLELSRGGRNVQVTGDLVVVENGTPGRYLLTGFPPATVIEVTAENGFMSAGGAGLPERIAVTAYDIGSVQTNALGDTEVPLGASFSTTGNGGSYENAPYSGDTQLRVTYWDPGVRDYVTFSKIIDFTGEVRSNFQLSEAQSLNFGTVFARGAANGQAFLRLSPTGQLDSGASGDAKMVSLARPFPGVLVASGAAANRDLQITVQSSDVLLKHSANPAGPHFILNELVTSPAGSGRTDEDGILEVRVGGKLSTQITSGTVVYPSGTYEGTYSVTLSY